MKKWILGAHCALVTACVLGTSIASAQTAAPEDKTPDHAKFAGRFGVGYFGVSDVPIATPGNNSTTVPAPVVGMRYWLQPDMGIDVGVGLYYLSGSTSAGGTSVDTPSVGAILLHGGLPFALASSKHFTFELIPELNLGYASSTVKGTAGAPDDSLSGLRVDLGARVGAEIHFGFIGIPELALEASVGAFLGYRKTTESPSGASSNSISSTQFSTTSFNNPWDIFRSSIAARYYL